MTHTTLPHHFLQSPEWAQFQRELGHTVVQDQGDGWSYMAIVESGHGPAALLGNRLYAPYGPSYSSTEALKAAIASMRQRALDQRCSYLRVEPLPTQERANESALGLAPTARSSQPALTLIADLTQETDEIILEFTKTNRYLWRRQADFGLNFTQHFGSSEAQDFLDMMDTTANRTGAGFHTADYYRQLLDSLESSKSAGLYYAVHDGKRVAAMLFVDDHTAKVRYYLHAGSRDEARKLNAMSIMLMHAMFEAKQQGFVGFDFFGVSPVDEPNHRWAGFSKFKRSFGGHDVAYPGTYELPVARMKYALLQRLRSIRA